VFSSHGGRWHVENSGSCGLGGRAPSPELTRTPPDVCEVEEALCSACYTFCRKRKERGQVEKEIMKRGRNRKWGEKTDKKTAKIEKNRLYPATEVAEGERVATKEMQITTEGGWGADGEETRTDGGGRLISSHSGAKKKKNVNGGTDFEVKRLERPEKSRAEEGSPGNRRGARKKSKKGKTRGGVKALGGRDVSCGGASPNKKEIVSGVRGIAQGEEKAETCSRKTRRRRAGGRYERE